MCGGKDRFRFDDKDGRGRYICNSCGAGDGFQLVQGVTGKSFTQIAKAISDLLGEKPVLVQKDYTEENRQRAAIKSIWEAAERPKAGGVVHRYLKNRLGLVWSSNAIREVQGKHHWAMVSKICGSDDTAQNVHLTYLTDDGHKADVIPNRRIMSGPLPDGSAIRLAPADEHMGIAEGIETAIAASVMFKIPVWAAVNAQNLAKWKPPAITQSVTVFADNDESFTGHAASYTLAKRLTLQYGMNVQVLVPPVVGQDWADVLAQVATDRGQL
jgi:putative DNA primase/helicase